jgi:hypothetical protein
MGNGTPPQFDDPRVTRLLATFRSDIRAFEESSKGFVDIGIVKRTVIHAQKRIENLLGQPRNIGLEDAYVELFDKEMAPRQTKK